jgi:RHS repeat-associated protein
MNSQSKRTKTWSVPLFAVIMLLFNFVAGYGTSEGVLPITNCYGPYVNETAATQACLLTRVNGSCVNWYGGECGPVPSITRAAGDCTLGRYACGYEFFSGSSGCPADTTMHPATGECRTAPLTPEKNFGSCKGSPSDYAGNPVKTSTGNKYAAETDISGFGRDRLTFTRYYNSGLALLHWNLQPAWKHTFDRSLSFATLIGTGVITAAREDGSSLFFNKNGSNWEPEADRYEKLVEVTDGGALTYHLSTTQDITEIYDAMGVLQSISDVAGNAQTLTYLPSGLLERVDSNTGESLLFTYDPQNRLSTLTDHAGRVWTYTYDGNDNLEYVYYPDGTTDTHTNNPYRRYHYEVTAYPGALTGISDWINGQEERYATYEYDAEGRAEATYHGLQTGVLSDRIEGVSIVYNADGTRTVTDSNNQASTYSNSSQFGTARLDGIAGPGCSSCGLGNTSYIYDPANNNLLNKTENGIITEYGNYNANGNRGYMIEAKGEAEEHRTDYTYDSRYFSKIATMTEPSVFSGNNRVTTYDYDDFGNRTSEVVDGFDVTGTPVTRITIWQYNGPLHQLSQIDGPRVNADDITQLRYYLDDPLEGNNRARLKEIEDANAVLTRSNIQYTATGKVASESRPNGLSMVYAYYPGNDRLQTLTESTQAVSHVTRWTYLATGEVETITTADGTTDATMLTFGYDAARRLTRITDGAGNYIQYTLDTEGNRTAVNIHNSTGALKRAVTQVFDSYNRLDLSKSGNDPLNPLEQFDPLYAPDGTLDQSTDGEGKITDYSYDGLRRLLDSTRDLGGLGALTQYDYDVSDRLTSVIDPNNGTTGYQYDDLGNLLQTTSPDTGTTVYTYDAAGNVKTKTTASGTADAVILNYSYDALNRLVSVTTPNVSDDITYTYDSCYNGSGRLCKVETGAANIFYAYDAFGNATHHQGVAYSYDAANRVRTLTYPSGTVLTYGYDSAGQINQVDLTVNGTTQPLASNISYTPFGGITSLTYGNGKSLTQTYDTAYRTMAQSVPSVLDLDYPVYDSNGNLRQRDDTTNTPVIDTSDFSYDALNRLDTASGIFGANWDYGYDLNGNRSLTNEGTPVTSVYEPNTNRLDQIGSDNVILSVAGNTLTSGNWTYSYTAHQRLAGADESGQPKASFSYNGLGQRVLKARPDGTGENFYFGQNGELLVETDNAGTVLVEYLYLNGELLAIYHPDTDQDGQTNQQEDALGTNPVNPDDDGDGLSNLDELLTFGTLVSNPDTDGDGVLDGAEITNGTDPSDPGSGYMLGDVNLDGQVNTGDLVVLTQYVLGTRPLPAPGTPGYTVADMNADGQLNVADLLILQRTILGLVWNEWTQGRMANTLLALWEGMIPKAEAAVTNGALYYVHNDHLGTPQVMTDEAGGVVWRGVYDPFGKASIDGGSSVEMNVRFSGQYYDQETGLHYNWLRYQDPTTGRYLTADPIGLAGGINPYLYANANPLTFIDPYGLYCLTQAQIDAIASGIGGGVGGLVSGAISGATIGGIPGAVALGLAGAVRGAGVGTASAIAIQQAGAAGGAGAGVVGENAGLRGKARAGTGAAVGAVIGDALGGGTAAATVSGAIGGAIGVDPVTGAVGGAVGGLAGSVAARILAAGNDCEEECGQ